MVKTQLERIATTLVTGTIGGILIGAFAAYLNYKSEAAVNVRPELADVSFIDAVLTRHGTDWFLYNHPEVGFSVFILIGVLLFATPTFYSRRWS